MITGPEMENYKSCKLQDLVLARTAGTLFKENERFTAFKIPEVTTGFYHAQIYKCDSTC